jgi:glycolate oxidase
MLELMQDEVTRALGLLGLTSFGKLDRSYLHQAAPANAPHVLSAFPLWEVEPYRY